MRSLQKSRTRSINKTQLVDALATRIGDRRTAATAVDGLLETIVDTVTSGDSVSITGFGVFEPRARAARVARNPRTGESVDVAATTVPAFRPGAGFRAARATPARRRAPAASANGAAPATEATAARTARPAKAKATFAAEPAVEDAKAAKATKSKSAPKPATAKAKAVTKAEKPKKAKSKK